MYTSSDKAIDLVSLKVENWLASLPISTLFILIVISIFTFLFYFTHILNYLLFFIFVNLLTWLNYIKKSSYICSKNPSWSDNTTLGIGTKGKRRKFQAGSMNQENDEEANLFKDKYTI